MKSTTQKEIWGWDAAPKIGRYVRPDGWDIGSLLEAGDDFSSFRLPTNSCMRYRLKKLKLYGSE